MGKSFWFGVALMILVIVASTFGGIYLSIRYGEIFKTAGLFIALLLVFFLMIFIQMGYKSKDNALDRGEVRRAITATLVATLLMIMFFGIETDQSLKNFFLGVLSTIVGFYFGYRKAESERQLE